MNVAYALPRDNLATWVWEPTQTMSWSPEKSRNESLTDIQAVTATNAVTVDRAQRALLQAYQEFRLPNWDGLDALPVTAETILLARRVVDVLPPGLPLPAFGAEPDGELTMEWYHSPRRLLSVSLNGSGVMSYAALFGTERHFGRVSFCGALPEALITLIRKVHFK